MRSVVPRTSAPVTQDNQASSLAEPKDTRRPLANLAGTATWQLAVSSFRERSPSPQAHRGECFGSNVASAATSLEHRSDNLEQEREKMNRVPAVVTLQIDQKLSKPEAYPACPLRVLTGLNVSTLAQLVISNEPINES
ncbi:hypothetical protein ON010_g681 [Phytophthora cinnamomi]|nr:hypothetical protein ON010_g681 [Phytophthora cinnamomi]